MLDNIRKVLACVISIGLTLAACSPNGSSTSATYEIKRCDYEDILIIEGYTESVNSVNINCPPDVDGTIISIVETGTYVKQGEVVCVIEDVNIADKYERLKLDLESAYAELEKLKASQQLETALLEAQVKNNDAEALLADFDSLQMLYMSPAERRTKELQLERAAIERARLMKKVDASKVMQEIDVMRIEKNIERIKRNIDDEQKKLESLSIRAPRDGIAIRAKRWPWSSATWTIGDNVWNGRTIITLPDFDEMKVIFHAKETEYKRLQIGDSIMYTFDAMPQNRAWGHITKMASIGQTRTEGSQVKTFEIEATIDSLLSPVEPGLSARCHIYLRHIPDTIVVPTISIFDKDSLKVVYVQKGRKHEERIVTLGLSSPKTTIVSEGLKEGETISLIKPQK
jgi:multidrug resistance efflux pump